LIRTDKCWKITLQDINLHTIQWLLEKFNMTVDLVILFFLLRSLSVPHLVHDALKLGHLKAI
jgi:hypothetical protein